MEYVSDVSLWADFLAEHGYELLSQIDSGSFSDVFAARSMSSRKTLAVKRMVARREVMDDPRVLAEISCLTQLTNRGACVIGLEDLLVKPDRLVCFVLELAPLGNLERYAAGHWPLIPKLLSSVCRQVLSALTYCHRLHIAHRDVHPSNVLLMSDHSVRLADFGLAFRCKDSAGRSQDCADYLGHESYLAPEVLQRAPYDAVQADMWSMGCLCAFMLTGKHPSAAGPSSSCLCLGGSRLRARRLGSKPSRLMAEASCPQHNAEARAEIALAERWRTSSCDSEGSVRSESDVDELLSPQASALPPNPPPWAGDPHPDPPRDPDLDPDLDPNLYSHPDSDLRLCPCECRQDDLCDMNTHAERYDVDCAVRHLAARLRVPEPSSRLSSEQALQLWRQSL